MLAVWTAQNVSPQRRGTALLNGCHDLELTQAQVRALSKPPGWPMGAEDVRDLQGTMPHGGRPMRSVRTVAVSA